MNERTKTSLEILQAAGLMGLLGNILLRQKPWGVNAFLFVTVFVVALLMLMRRRRPELLTWNTVALTGAMVFFSAMFVIRDAIELKVYDTFAILIIMGVILLVNFDIKANIAGAFHYAVGFVWSGLTSLFGPFVLLGADIDWKVMPGNKISKNIFSVLRGIAIALPLLLIFGALFMAADAVFEGWVNRAFNFDIETIISHVMLTAVFAWLTAGYFRGAIGPTFGSVAAAAANAAAAATTTATTDSNAREKKDESTSSFVAKVAAEPGEDPATLPNSATVLEHINRSDPPDAKPEEAKTETSTPAPTPEPKKRDWQNFDSSSLPSVFTLGTVETVIILGLIDLLFLSFVIVQIPYLFGGMDLVQNTPDFKLAEYARRGFGELVAVAALVLPMLLVSHWLLRRETGVPERLFRILAGVQIGLLFVIMASAVQRLLLLTGELGYGLTTVRFYPMVIMTWLAVVFIWFALTVFRGGRKYFAWGALWSAIVVLGVTNLINPDEFIVRTNLKLMHQGREFDGVYNASLSADSIPALLSELPDMSASDQCEVKYRISRHYLRDHNGDGDLRSFNLGRREALEWMASSQPAIDNQLGCPERIPPFFVED